MMITSQAVVDLLTAYWFEIDHRGGADAHLFFTEDGELSFDAAHFRGRAAIQGVYQARASRGPRISRHVVTNVHVTRTDGDAVHVVSALTLYAQDGAAPALRVVPVAIADVFDHLVSTPSGILIVSRAIRNQFVNPDAEFAVPMQSQTPPTNVDER